MGDDGRSTRSRRPAQVSELLGTLADALPALGIPTRDVDVVDTWVGERPGWDAEACLEVVQAAQRLSTALDGLVLVAARELSARTIEAMADRRGIADIDDLPVTKREHLRARAKSVTAHEIEALTGLGRGESRDLVALACAPRAISLPVEEALRSGVSSWRLARAFWRRCGGLEHEAAADVSEILFGDEPGRVAVERLDPEGDLRESPWHHREFYRALDREATRVESADAAAQRAARRARYAARDAYAIAEEDGTARFVITADSLSIVALAERIHVLARKARAAGDTRTLAQLRSDLSRALLLHGTLPLPALPEDPSLITPEDVSALVEVLSGAVTPQLQVVVPWDVLSDRALVPAPTGRPTSPDNGVRCCGGAGASDRAAPVGELLGRFGRFLSPEQIRELAGRSGATMARLLVDPRDGRCIERSIGSYRPDAQMRKQLAAADVLCRAPGCTEPARDNDLDHVAEYLLGGETSEVNLMGLHRGHHALRTEKFWRAVLEESRNVTFTTFYGRAYRTRVHDYRQYGRGVASDETDSYRGAPGDLAGLGDRQLGGPLEDRDEVESALMPSPAGLRDRSVSVDERREAASRAIYAMLTHRPVRARAAGADDDPDGDEEIFDGLSGAVWVRALKGHGAARLRVVRNSPNPRPWPDQGADPVTISGSRRHERPDPVTSRGRRRDGTRVGHSPTGAGPRLRAWTQPAGPPPF